jgi:excisionase family DNA binding protein
VAHIIADQAPETEQADQIPETEQLLTGTEVARMFKVEPRTVAEWARLGRLRSVRTPGGQHRRYPLSAVLATLRNDSDNATARIESEAEQVRTALRARDSEAAAEAFNTIRRQHPEDAQQVAFRLSGLRAGSEVVA